MTERTGKDSRQAEMTVNNMVLVLTLIACLAVLVSFGVAFSAKTPDGKSDSDVLARIGDEAITQKDVDEILKKVPENKRGKFKDTVLDQLIEVRVFSNEARKAGMDKDSKFREALEKATNEILSKYFIKKYIDAKSEPAEKELKEYYSEHKDRFVIPEGVLIQEIVVKNKENAEDILMKLKKGQSFEEMVKRKSISPTWKNDGRLWLYKGRMDPELEKVAFNLEKEKLSDVIKTAEGYEIIKVLEKSDKRDISLEEAKASIRYDLYWKKRKELMDSYFEKAKVDRKPADKGVLFKIGDEVFKEEIIAPILTKAPEKEKEKIRHQWINYYIETAVFSREAKKAGLDKDTEIVNELKQRTDDILSNIFRKKIIDEKAQVSDKDIEDYYQSHPEEFREPFGVRIKTILVKTKEEAENILKELKQGASFDTLAKEKSIHPSASQGGDIGWFGKGQKDPELEKAAFSLDKDRVSDIIKTSDGYQIIKVIDRKGGDLKPLNEIKAKLKMKIQVQKLKEEKQSYYEKAGVKILKENVN